MDNYAGKGEEYSIKANYNANNKNSDKIINEILLTRPNLNKDEIENGEIRGKYNNYNNFNNIISNNNRIIDEYHNKRNGQFYNNLYESEECNYLFKMLFSI